MHRRMLSLSTSGLRMNSESDLWAGAINGVHAVFDPSIQLENSRWILLFLVAHSRLVAYEKAHARTVSREIDAGASSAACETYRKWRNSQQPSTIEAATASLRQKDETTARRLSQATAVHRKRLEKASVAYQGVIEPDGRGYVRNAECRDCHRTLGSEAHLQCVGCRWIVCSACGACGCGRPA
jgi:hypothetical protein